MYANLVCVLFGARWTHAVDLSVHFPAAGNKVKRAVSMN